MNLRAKITKLFKENTEDSFRMWGLAVISRMCHQKHRHPGFHQNQTQPFTKGHCHQRVSRPQNGRELHYISDKGLTFNIYYELLKIEKN